MTVTQAERVTSLNDQVAAEIRAWMGRRRVNQAALGRALNENEMWVSRRLRGTQAITITDLQRFADALEVGVGDLLPRAARTQTTVPNVGLPARPRDNRPNGRPSRVATSPTSRRPVRVGPDASLIAA